MDSLSPATAARSAVPAAPALHARPLSASESAHLDRLRDWLRADGTDATDAVALDARWARLLESHPPQAAAPAGVTAAIGIAVGDLLVASTADAVWGMCPGPDGATPGVLLLDRPHAPVLPVLDAHARWRARVGAWAVDYVERAAAHLAQGHPRIPTPHPSPDAPVHPDAVGVVEVVESVGVVDAVDVADVADVLDTDTPVVAPQAEGAWTPTFRTEAAPAAQPEAAVPTPGRGTPAVGDRPLTPEDLPHRPSERVQDLALRALELALERAVHDVAGSAPFVLVREDHDVEVLDFPHSDAGLAQARDAARTGGWSAAAVAWTSPADASRPYPRVVVDASAAGRPGIRVAHSYAHDEHGSREIGGPQVVGQAAPVL